MLDAAVSIVLERRRPDTQRSPAAQQRAAEAIRRSVATLGTELDPAPDVFDLGQIAIACALEYLEFRLPDLQLLRDHRAVDDWRQATGQRRSLVATRPPT
jgi:glutathione S-transferase